MRMSRAIASDLRATRIVFRNEAGAENRIGADTNCSRTSETRHQLRYGHAEGSSQQFQITNTDFLPSVLQVRDETPVHSHVLGHIDLRPLLPLAESPYPLPKLTTDITGHARNYGCRLSPVNRL